MRARETKWLLSAGLGLLLVACSGAPRGEGESEREGEGEVEDVLPAGVTRGQAAREFHDSQLRQLVDAHRAGDWHRMEQILVLPRGGASAEQRQRFEIFDRLLRGGLLTERTLEFAGFRAGAQQADSSPEFEMDAALELALVISARAGHEVTIRSSGAGNARSLVTVRASIEDFRVDGSRSRAEIPIVRGLTRDVTIRPGEPLAVPLQEPETAGPAVLVRLVRFTGVLRPVGIQVNGEEAAVKSIPLESLELRRFPKGFASVRKDPARILRNAMGAPDRYLGHIFVASWFLAESESSEERTAAIEQLIQLLRTGSRNTHRTAMACLTRLAGDAAPAGRDRESWLAWWSLRENQGR